MKDIDFDQSSSPVLSAPTLHIIVKVASAWHLTIYIVDVTNDLHNNIKASSDFDHIDWPTHCIACFKLRFPNICI